MPPQNAFSECELHAFADGELDGVKMVEMAAWLREHPDIQARIEAWRGQKTAIVELFERPQAYEQEYLLAGSEQHGLRKNVFLEQSLAVVGETIAPSPIMMVSLAAACAACVLCFAVAAIHGAQNRSRNGDDEFKTAHMADINAATLTLNVAAWRTFAREDFSDNDATTKQISFQTQLGLGATPAIPEARLVAFRLLPAMSGPVGFFVFDTAQSERISFTLARASSAFEPQSLRFAELGSFLWRIGGYECTLVGAVSQSRLKELAQTIRLSP